MVVDEGGKVNRSQIKKSLIYNVLEWYFILLVVRLLKFFNQEGVK